MLLHPGKNRAIIAVGNEDAILVTEPAVLAAAALTGPPVQITKGGRLAFAEINN